MLMANAPEIAVAMTMQRQVGAPPEPMRHPVEFPGLILSNPVEFCRVLELPFPKRAK
jgi:hypothetical protein